MKVVLDTNVVVSAFLSPTGAPAQIFQHWHRQTFELVVSEPLLSEYRRVLMYQGVAARHGMPPSDVAQAIEGIRHLSLLVTPQETITVIHEDPHDNIVLECGVAGGAEYIVSGDAHLLTLREFRDIQILSPTVFLAVLQQNGGARP